jgi:hypothetical protein
MSETINPIPGPESQQERWLKYGGNVALAIVIVVLLASALVFAAERKTKRLDTTTAGLYSLKPQTLNIVRDNPQKIQITSLYTHAKPRENATSGEDNAAVVSVADQADKVADLLEEYKNKGRNIEVDAIDPDANPSKVDDLIADVTKRYGGQVDKYNAFAKSYPQKFKAVTEQAAAEADKIKPLLPAVKASLEKMKASLQETVQANKTPDSEQIKSFNDLAELYNQLGRISRYVTDAPSLVEDTQNLIQRSMKQKPPAYKAIADSAKENLGDLSANLGAVAEYFKKAKDDAKVPEAIRKYMADSQPRFEAMKKQADDLVAEATALGELKLDTLREALRQRNSILVRGEKEWKIISYDQVWRAENRSGLTEAVQVKPRFAGEQMITTAIWGLQHPTKVKVVFVRPGGPPLTEPPTFFRPEGGVLSTIADRLRDYNFEVLEKDLTGMWAMQQQQGMSAPEPSDADIKDAIWVVVDVPSQQSQFGPAPTISAKVAEHLANGGSAMFLAMPRADDMSAALRDWGIAIRTDLICVHELIKSEGPTSDLIEQFKKTPGSFEIRDWGKHEITTPMGSLPGIFFNGSPVTVAAVKGVKATSIIPIPDAPAAPRSWGESDLEPNSLRNPTFNPDKGDMPGPLYGGACAEKEGAGRVVAIGSINMMISGVVDFPDPQLLQQQRTYVVRFPGNGELFANSIYWLSKQDTMIAISPAAMDVGRIEGLSRGAQSFWRVGVLLVGVPLAVIAAGTMVWITRRD